VGTDDSDIAYDFKRRSGARASWLGLRSWQRSSTRTPFPTSPSSAALHAGLKWADGRLGYPCLPFGERLQKRLHSLRKPEGDKL
jgi:hypothetical protein